MSTEDRCINWPCALPKGHIGPCASDRTAEELLTRPRCLLLGCIVEESAPCCQHCGADLYEGFIQRGKLEPLFRLYWRIRNFILRLGPKRCAICKRRYVRGYDEYCCSWACFDQWLPF